MSHVAYRNSSLPLFAKGLISSNRLFFFFFFAQWPEHEFRFSVNVYIRQITYSIWQQDGTLSEQSFAWGTAGKSITRHHEILSC